MSKSQVQALDRKNVIVDGRKIRRLQRLLRTPSESEAIRIAVNRALDASAAIAALERLRKRGTWGRHLA